jgi:hypothetical protein
LNIFRFAQALRRPSRAKAWTLAISVHNMKTARFCLLLVLAHASAFAQEPASNEALVKLAASLDKLTRVTEQRISRRAIHTDLCAPSDIPDHAKLVGRPDVGIHVYVTPASAGAFKDSAARFPVGTVVLKQKFPALNAKEADFYTGMLKRETGFNPGCGDWEFFTMAGDRRAVTARGRIESCMDCHRQYSKTDFVTKRLK